jgi:hypothetical protein
MRASCGRRIRSIRQGLNGLTASLLPSHFTLPLSCTLPGSYPPGLKENRFFALAAISVSFGVSASLIQVDHTSIRMLQSDDQTQHQSIQRPVGVKTIADILLKTDYVKNIILAKLQIKVLYL